MLIGPNTKMMLSGISKRQSAVSHCTTEAEMIAAARGLRAEAIPFQILWDILRRTNTPDGNREYHNPMKSLHYRQSNSKLWRTINQ